MRSLKSLLPLGGKARRPGSTRVKPGRVPYRAYPLWRRTGVRLGIAAIMTMGAGTWLWLSGYARAASVQIDTWGSRQVIDLGITVNRITVSGRSKTSTDEILAAVGMARGQSLFEFDAQAAKSRIEALGWVKTATVSRYFPDVIHVELSERRPFALWQSKRQVSVIDRAGAVITSADLDRFQTLPIVVGAGARYAAAELIDVLGTEPALFRRVQAASRVGGRRWNLHLDNNVEIQLPAIDQGRAWQRLALLEQDHQILGRDVAIIDLRAPDRLALRLTDGAVERRRNPEEEA
jgi:cell division protein FtsQ